MSQKFHKRWLLFVTSFVIWSVAPVLFLGTMAEYSEPARWVLDFLNYPVDGSATFDSPDTRFISAILGGIVLGWGVFIICIALWVYDSNPEGVRKSILVALLCWFFLDSLGSITSGHAPNAVINVFLLLTAVGPMWVPARDTMK